MSKPKSNSVVTTEANMSIGEMVFTVLGAGTVTLHVERMHPDNRSRAMYHGLKQRCGDMAALERNRDTGLPASPADKLSEITRLVEHLESGSADWTLRRAAASEGGLLFQALTRFSPDKGAERIREYIETLSNRQRAALLASDKLKAIVDSIRAEAVADVDTEELLGTL